MIISRQIIIYISQTIVIICLIGFLLKYKSNIMVLDKKVNELAYKKEYESVLKDKYFEMLRFQLLHQDLSINRDLIVQDKTNLNSYILFDLVTPGDLILCIPEYACTDCIKQIMATLKTYSSNDFNRVFILSVFIDIEDTKRFISDYDISGNKFFVYNIESDFFWKLTNNRILLLEANEKYCLHNFVILDGEINELLITFIRNNL